MSTWSDPYISELFLNATPLIDVRAPIEFLEGALPNSINLPLMNNEERRLVGICYKEKGQAAAIELGHQLVSDETKRARITAWLHYLTQHPQAQVFCFRGGLRSQISCQWITQAGVERRPIPGGYKKMRQFFLSWLNDAPLPRLTRVGGLTGSGKTALMKNSTHFTDLESLAHHRGSAFGNIGPQPSQTTFENALGYELLKHPTRMLVEDEAVTIGKLHIPKRLYFHMRQSPLVVVEAPIEERVASIYREYVAKQNADFFLDATITISKKLGGKRTAELIHGIVTGFEKGPGLANHQSWITQLLVEYYDPFYQKDLARQEHLIAFRGSAQEVEDYLSKTF